MMGFEHNGAMTSLQLFHLLVAGHITTGAIGLIAFWVPVASVKGGQRHRWWGRLFVRTMLLTGTFAIAISLVTLSDPVGTHPKLIDHPELGDPTIITAIFGWMMLYLAVLTINLAWYGDECIRLRRDHKQHKAWYNIFLQLVLFVTAFNCVWIGWQIGQPLMLGISVIGFATVATNLRFMLNARPSQHAWQLEHIKGLVGAGISVYTAFFAFGAVRYFPDLALYPGYWAIPLVVGLGLILWHWQVVIRRSSRARAQSEAIS